MSFRNQTVLTYEHKSYSVFIQTDKAIYKPGQLGKSLISFGGKTFSNNFLIIFEAFDPH